jgi:hypothetical protein
MASFVLLPQVQLAFSLVLQLFLPAQHSSFNLLPILCGFKLLILLVDSFLDLVNVITSNSTVLKQRKKLYWCKLHNSCYLQESCFSSNWFQNLPALPIPWACWFQTKSYQCLVQQLPTANGNWCIRTIDQWRCEDPRTSLVCDGFRTCLMVFRIVAGVVAGVVAELLPQSSPEEMRSTSTTLLPGSSLEESALTSMLEDRFFLRVEEKTLPLHGGRRWSPPTWPLRACTASSPGPTKNRPLPWRAE